MIRDSGEARDKTARGEDWRGAALARGGGRDGRSRSSLSKVLQLSRQGRAVKVGCPRPDLDGKHLEVAILSQELGHFGECLARDRGAGAGCDAALTRLCLQRRCVGPMAACPRVGAFLPCSRCRSLRAAAGAGGRRGADGAKGVRSRVSVEKAVWHARGPRPAGQPPGLPCVRPLERQTCVRLSGNSDAIQQLRRKGSGNVTPRALRFFTTRKPWTTALPAP